MKFDMTSHKVKNANIKNDNRIAYKYGMSIRLYITEIR